MTLAFFPRPASPDFPNCAGCDAILDASLSTRESAFAYLSHSCPGQFGHSTLLSGGLQETPLANAVSCVVYGCPQEQMPNKHASGYITGMQHTEAIRDWPSVQNPGNSMCGYQLTVEPEVSIAIPVPTASPKPAAIALLDFCLESLFESWIWYRLAQKHVVRAHAGSGITCVQQLEALRNRAVKYFPGHAMCVCSASLKVEDAVAILLSSNPEPAFIGVMHFQLELLFRSHKAVWYGKSRQFARGHA
jgi:hypothetical protein